MGYNLAGMRNILFPNELCEKFAYQHWLPPKFLKPSYRGSVPLGCARVIQQTIWFVPPHRVFTYLSLLTFVLCFPLTFVLFSLYPSH